MKIAIITTHPVQYHAPLFSYLSNDPNYSIKVFYTLGNQGVDTYDKGFGITRNWNLDLLSGYEYEFLDNASKNPSSNLFWRINNPKIINKIKDFNPNAIIVYGWKHHSHLTVLQYFKEKVPVLLRGDSTTIDDNSTNPFLIFLRYQFLKWVYKNVDYALSPGIASDQYFKKVGIPEANIVRTPHAVDNERFSSFSQSEETSLQILRKKLLISENDFVFLFAGKFIDKKNPLLLIKAFSELAKTIDCIKLLLVGNGVLELEMKNEIASFPDFISKRILFLPFQDQQQIKLIYRLSNVFVLPSISETWGLSVNESLASGTPVLISNKCGCAYDLVKHNENGLVFESNNPLDLFAKMKEISEAGVYGKLKKNAQHSISNYTFESFEKALNKIVTEIAV